MPYGCFAYNLSRINVGSVDWQHVRDRVIVSPLYVVFEVSHEILPEYLYYYLKSQATIERIKNATTGSVRDNLKFSALSNFTIDLLSFLANILQEGRQSVINHIYLYKEHKKSALSTVSPMNNAVKNIYFT